ncbi:MAG: 4-hydroxy-3-methylbut-2-enyl diphosphate reductase, partial [Verrucomicrobiota bacterium]
GDTVVVVGGANSNNTKQLVKRSQALGCTAYHIQTADDLDESWFREAQEVGVTAGTSTLKETVQDVVARLKTWADLPEPALV